MNTAIAIVCLLGGLFLHGHAWVKNDDFLVRTEMCSGGIIALGSIAAMFAIFFGLL